MKKLEIAFIAVLLTASASCLSAQGKYGADSANCIKYLSYYKEYFKQKSYDDALPNWRQAYKYCPPTANQTMLVDGTTLMRKLIFKNAKNDVYKQALIDSLFTLHDLRAQNYPKYAVTALNNKGLDLTNYVKGDYKKLYEGYNAIIEANGPKTSSNLFVFNLNSAIELYKVGALSSEEVINTYQRNMDLLDKAVPANEAAAAQNAKVKTDLESLFISSKVASCEDLLKLFGARYEAAPEDKALVTNIVKILSITDGCMDNDLFLKAVTSLYKLEPSYNSAYYLYRLHSSKGNVEEAEKYLQEAIDYPESDSKVDADYTYQLAAYAYKNGRPDKAYATAKKAIELDETMAGKCYFLIATIWGSTNCGGDEIARRAPYWVAVDYLIKARNADPTLAEEAGRMIAQYSKYYPQTAEAFMYNFTDGQSYNVSCKGMNATTTVRTQK